MERVLRHWIRRRGTDSSTNGRRNLTALANHLTTDPIVQWVATGAVHASRCRYRKQISQSGAAPGSIAAARVRTERPVRVGKISPIYAITISS